MNSAKQVAEMVATWRANGATKSEIVIKGSEACLGWAYCWGAIGIACTVANRKRYINNSRISTGDSNLIKKRCQVLNGSASACTGCKYLPNNELTDMNDCIGFVKERFKDVGINIVNDGCTLAWNNKTQWSQKGSIKNMPDTVCCVFQKDPTNAKRMQHVGIHVGGGRIIHCSGEVKVGSTNEKAWTDFAIPVGMDGDVPVPTPTHKTVKRGSTGEDVVYVQTRLIELGYDLSPYGADGKFGAKTEEAVKNFQRVNGLEADGIVGQKTYAALENATTDLYTVTIQHLGKAVADSLVQKYGGTMTLERG